MGMDQQTAASLQKGVGLANDFMDLVNGSADSGQPDYSAQAEANAMLVKQDTAESAYDQKQAAKKEAAIYRETAEQKRAGSHTNWGKSNLAMSGSKQLIRQSERLKDTQAEDDLLFQGDQQVQSTLNQGRHKGNLLRINGEATANNTTLSLGSKLYKYGG